MCDIEDISNTPEQSQRIREVIVDCYNQTEELSAFEVYFADAMQFPFPATWRDPDEPGHSEPVTMLRLEGVVVCQSLTRVAFNRFSFKCSAIGQSARCRQRWFTIYKEL